MLEFLFATCLLLILFKLVNIIRCSWWIILLPLFALLIFVMTTLILLVLVMLVGGNL